MTMEMQNKPSPKGVRALPFGSVPFFDSFLSWFYVGCTNCMYPIGTVLMSQALIRSSMRTSMRASDIAREFFVGKQRSE